ncbi:L-2-amino-thiazoline-4-carboxylic acid hydrolase [Nocardiopsis suaedae]|uniref:L-2-amino-thiazoline-4-carboxylic acid hydrolase n=1 Tax=Nocardiopsis suaedae TaxID=3018444 RepID=A0ABT4TEW6_9ACTN|nr:L-2-amino-thiazoline-4-carboxylic acid hydrolase [Nocardiopsis suaedae]MDA2803248.1 L-2-amino-thiazoline-4-carboxylic acid hydrolase [Nocardiopsis suaedae]
MSTDRNPRADRFGLDDDAYVPDPERDTAMLLDAFYRRLGEELDDRSPAAAMRARQDEVEAANRSRVVDAPARQNLRMVAALMAAYEALRSRLGRDAALDLVRVCFNEPFADAIREGTRARLDDAEDAFSSIVEMSKAREEFAFGKGFVFDRAADDGGRYHVDVHRCFFHEVLSANGAPELTPVLCAFDAAWIEAIDPGGHGFRFERPTTIGTGGTHCPFHFDRTRET